MALGTPFGAALNWSYPSIEDLTFENGTADPRLPQTANAVPTVNIDALHVMHLTDPNGVAVTFLTGEALPPWAQPFR